jgi:hypothetical protein
MNEFDQVFTYAFPFFSQACGLPLQPFFGIFLEWRRVSMWSRVSRFAVRDGDLHR